MYTDCSTDLSRANACMQIASAHNVLARQDFALRFRVTKLEAQRIGMPQSSATALQNERTRGTCVGQNLCYYVSTLFFFFFFFFSPVLPSSCCTSLDVAADIPSSELLLFFFFFFFTSPFSSTAVAFAGGASPSASPADRFFCTHCAVSMHDYHKMYTTWKLKADTVEWLNCSTLQHCTLRSHAHFVTGSVRCMTRSLLHAKSSTTDFTFLPFFGASAAPFSAAAADVLATVTVAMASSSLSAIFTSASVAYAVAVDASRAPPALALSYFAGPPALRTIVSAARSRPSICLKRASTCSPHTCLTFGSHTQDCVTCTQEHGVQQHETSEVRV